MANDEFHIEKPGNRAEKQFIQFAEDCRSNNLKLHLCKPLPLCIFSEENMKKYLLDGFLRTSCTASRSGFTQNLTINPDLSTLPCNAIGSIGPSIEQFKDLQEAGQYHSKLLKSFLSRPYHDNCLECILYYKGLCQGNCLAERFEMDKNLNRKEVLES